MSRTKKTFGILLTIALSLTLHSATSPARDSNIYSPAESIAALGDSISQAANACNPWVECPEESWSTGSNPQVESFADRLGKVLNAAEEITVYNNSHSFTKVEALVDQAQIAVTQKAELITVLSGANDICTTTVEGMTTPDDFRESVKQTFRTLKSLPRSKIFVASIPNIYNLWEVGKDNPEAVAKWEKASTCQSLLANPLSMDEADVARRNIVKERIVAFNTIWAEECARADNCLFDRNALYNTSFTVNEISTTDYFHPSIEGQATIAKRAWDFYVMAHILILRGSSHSSSPDAPIILIENPVDQQTVWGTEFEAVVYVDSKHPLERVYADTQLGSVDLTYNKEDEYWTLILDTTLAPNGIQTTFSVVAIDEEENIGISNDVTVTIDNSIVIPPVPIPTDVLPTPSSTPTPMP